VANEYLLNPESKFIDVGSVKAKPIVEVLSGGVPKGRFCPTHPMAGREIGGAESARADLFLGRPWIFSSSGVDADVVEAAKELIELLGAEAFELGAQEHDKAVALISHMPQILASLLAKQLLAGQVNWLDLSGAGLRDMTRIAASDSKLWGEIISLNRDQISPLLEKFAGDLNDVIAALGGTEPNSESIENVIVQGNEGRKRIPGKHGGKARNYTLLPVVIEDKPGQLAALFNECAQAKVNVEDLSIEHSPGQFTGLITLFLSQDDAQTLHKHLLMSGWNVHLPR
jgi:prephenate dehydrogenase